LRIWDWEILIADVQFWDFGFAVRISGCEWPIWDCGLGLGFGLRIANQIKTRSQAQIANQAESRNLKSAIATEVPWTTYSKTFAMVFVVS
jgi:hypothetical protein